MEVDESPKQTSLTFKPKFFIGGNSKKLVSTSELFNELKKMSKELSTLDQEAVDTRTLEKPAKELVSKGIMEHQNQAVQAYCACCLADILRLFAPDAPYTGQELERVFKLFVKQLKTLKKKDNSLYVLGEYLLESLSTIKTVALTAEMDTSENMMILFFQAFFEIIKPDQPKKNQIMMAEILQQLIEENSKVPKEVIDVLLVQFLKKRQDENRAAHQMAVDVCNSTMTIMQKYVCQYFSEIIVESSRELNREGSAGDVQLENLQNAHYLILELFKTAPGLLQNVIPQIEEELFVDHVDVRTIATQVVGEMFSLRGYVLTKRYEGTWESWKRRRNDKAVAVRIKWVEKAVEMLAMQTQLVKELEDGIIEKLEDVDEKVRKAACEAFSRLELTKNAQIGISKKMVQALSERCKDRRVLPRSEACQAISHIYEGVYSEIEAGDPAVIEKFSEIPAALMKLYFVDQKDITCNVEAALYTKIFGLSSVKDDDKRAMRLVRILTYCDKKAMIGFSGLLKRQGDLVAEVQVMLKFAEMLHKKTTRAREHKESTSGSGGEEEEEDGDSNDVLDAKLEESINRVSAYFPEPLKFASGLSVLLKQKDKDSDKNKDSDMALLAHCGRLRKMMDVSSDYKSIRKEQKEFMRRVCEDSPTIIDTMAMLVRSISLACINKSIIIPLVKIVQKKTNYSVMSRSQGGGSGVSSGLISRNNSSSNIISYTQGSVLGTATATATATIAGTTAVTSVPNAAQNLLLLVMKIQPRMFVAHTESLLTLFEDPDIISDQEAEDNLYMISLFSRTYPSQLGYSDKFHRTLSEYVKTGTIKMAKYAATILSTSKKYADYNGENGSLEQLVDEVIDLLLGSAGYSDAKQCKVLLASLSRFVTYKQGVFDTNRLDELTFELFGFLEGRESSRLQMNIIKQEMEVDRNEEELEESIRRKEKAGKTSDANGDKDGWIDRYSLPDAEICKILAIKVLVNRCYSYNNKIKSTESILDEGRKTLFMLRKYTQQQDQLGTQDNTSDDSSSVFKDHLRLTSAACMLKLCRQSRYDQMVVLSDILDLALIVQDPNYNVRFQFVTKKLVESLSALRIKPKFVPLLFFAAYEPEAELRDLIERFIQVTMMDINSKLIKVMASAPTTEDTANSNMFNGIMEYSLIGLLILLTYHPDWDANGQQQQQQQQQEGEEENGGNDEPQVDNLTIIKIFSKYIEFYINNVVNAENISLVYFYAMMMKTYRDRYLGYIEPVPQLQPHGLPGLTSASTSTAINITNNNNNNNNNTRVSRLWKLSEISLYLLLAKKSSTAHFGSRPITTFPPEFGVEFDNNIRNSKMNAGLTLDTSNPQQQLQTQAHSYYYYNMYLEKLTVEQQAVVANYSFLPLNFKSSTNTNPNTENSTLGSGNQGEQPGTANKHKRTISSGSPSTKQKKGKKTVKTRRTEVDSDSELTVGTRERLPRAAKNINVSLRDESSMPLTPPSSE